MLELLATVGSGLLLLAGIAGIGLLVVRSFRTTGLAFHWYAAFAMIGGIAVASLLVQLLALAGSSRTSLRSLGVLLLIAGAVGQFAAEPVWRRSRPSVWALGFLGVPIALLSFIAVAPSTKIDELHYHMLVGRRIVEDGGFRLYQLPYEQAISPQMGYQIFESVLHAMGTPDAGNVLSLGFSVTLLILVYGVIVEATSNSGAALLATAACTVGLYPAVWHVTAGAHALGDLATATALAAVFWPGSLKKILSPFARIAWIALACAVAASTKISMVGVCALLTGYVVVRFAARGSRARTLATAAGTWLMILGPPVGWSLIHTGAPFGAAFAHLFGSSAYQPEVFQEMEFARIGNQTGLWEALKGAGIFLNGGFLLLAMAGIWACVKQPGRFGFFLSLVVLQCILIAVALPHEFRFLGGLQYGFVIAGAIGLPKPWTKWLPLSLLLLTGPWLAAELYYSAPFAAVDLGIISRSAFLKRYVAFREDFQKLDRLLPADAKLYVPNVRLPAFYAPRPVLFTLADWDHRTPLYRFLLISSDVQPETPQVGLVCGAEIYRNDQAVVAAFRTPGRVPERGIVIVQPCR